MEAPFNDFGFLRQPPGKQYVRTFLFSRRIGALLSRVHLIARVLLVLCLSTVFLRAINTERPNLLLALVLSFVSFGLLLSSGANRKVILLYAFLNVPALLSLFTTWIIFYPVAGSKVLFQVPIYSGTVTPMLIPQLLLVILCTGLWFWRTRKIVPGLLIGLALSWLQNTVLPVPMLTTVHLSIFHQLTFKVTDQGLYIAITKVVGYTGMLLSTLALLVSAREVELIGALRQLRVHHAIIFFISTMFRSLDLALVDYEMIRQAQITRAVHARPRSLLRQLRDLAYMAIPMVAVMLRRSSEMGDALLARGYTLKHAPVDFYEASTTPWRLIDWLVVMFCLGLLVLAFVPRADLPLFLKGCIYLCQ